MWNTLLVGLVLLSAFALVNVLRQPRPGEALKELLGGLLVVGVIVAVGATILRVGWKVFSWAWS